MQQRDLDEVYINSYNIEWIRAWNGNMDIQIVLDYFAVITYVTDYYAKDDTGTLEIIEAALKQSEAHDVKDKMKTVAHAFLTHRQMGEAEAVYRLLPSMTLKKSNVGCQWVSLGEKEQRSKRFKKATEKDLEANRTFTKIKDMEGLWFEQQDMLSKYLRRSQEIEDMCLAQFAKMFRSYSKRKEKDDDTCGNDEDEGIDVNEDNIETDGGKSDSENADNDAEAKFHYIMTYEDNNKDGKPLPQIIQLNNPYPGEPALMSKRSYPAVLRFNKTNKDKNPRRYMLSELMLYRPFREEFNMDDVERMYNEEHNGNRKVQIVKSQVMEHLEGVEEARYYIEQAKKQIDLTYVRNKLDPAL